MTRATMNHPIKRSGRCRFRAHALRGSCNRRFLSRIGHRFYNPDTGRWLNRDPIKERGGPNVYVFIQNDGVNRWDRLGLVGGCGIGGPSCYWWDPYRSCRRKCNGQSYNPTTHCCCNGTLYEKAPKPTGIRLCSAPAHDYPWVDHVWLEVDNVAIDSVSGPGWNPNGSALISDASDYVNDPNKTCADTNLSECDYDIQAYKDALKQLIQTIMDGRNPDGTHPDYNYCVVGQNCGHFAQTIMNAPAAVAARKCD